MAKKRRKNTKAKGNHFEREICKQLSEWFTYGKSDDVFWRSTNSGGRSTFRQKAGKRTSNSAGDIAALDKRGLKLLKVLTFELKRGYNDVTMMSLIDNLESTKTNQFLEFVQQAHVSGVQARSMFWALIHSRDRRQVLIYLPWEFVTSYNKVAETNIHKRVATFCTVKSKSLRRYSGRICCFVLRELLEELDPSEVKKLWELRNT